VLTYDLLNRYKEIAHFCTDREGGASMGNYASFNMSPFTGDNQGDYSKNKSVLCEKYGIDPNKLIIPHQTHGTDILEIDESFLKLPVSLKSKTLDGIDALFTSIPKICIGITTADCVPLIFFDPQKQVVAVAHAGWRGTCGRIGEKTIQTLIDTYHCNPVDIRIIIGPSISVNAYEVGKEVADNFEKAGFELSKIIIRKNGSYFLDLWKANQLSVDSTGVIPENIEISGFCTFTEHERFFSARRLGIKSGRMLSGIMLIG